MTVLGIKSAEVRWYKWVLVVLMKRMVCHQRSIARLSIISCDSKTDKWQARQQLSDALNIDKSEQLSEGLNIC
jgi:hypothetical protein